MNTVDRRGFTLVELLTVVILGGLLVLATYQALMTNSRIYAVNNAQIQGQQMLRAGVDVLFGELREISSQEGDLVEMGADSLRVRAQREFGVACGVNYTLSPPELTVLTVGPTFKAGDSVFVFHDNDPERASDDEWFGGPVRSVSSTTCGGNPAQRLRLPFLATTAAAFSPDSVRLGAPVRGFDIFTYGAYQISGETYLGRRHHVAPDPDPLVGPLQATGGVAFRYLDTLGAVTAIDTDVAQIEVILRHQTGVRGFQNELVSDSILVRVRPRN
jgi:prepilin-type N-terminal cleavage/methylation domain-containing protein